MAHPYRNQQFTIHRSNLGPWLQDNVAASQAAVALKPVPANTSTEVAMMRPGSVLGIGAAFTLAPAGTDLTLIVTKNGSPLSGCELVVAAGATLGRSVGFKVGAHKFVAGDRIGVTVTTGAGWTATTADLSVMLEIETKGWLV